MIRWTTLLGELEVAPGEVLVYLDPHGLDHPVGDGELYRAATEPISSSDEGLLFAA